MEAVHQWLSTLVDFMGESKVLGAVIIMAGALIAAKVVGFFMERVFLAFARKSKFRLDDALLSALHRPVSLSIVLAGALTAVQWVGPQPPFTFILLAVLKTNSLVAPEPEPRVRFRSHFPSPGGRGESLPRTRCGGRGRES